MGAEREEGWAGVMGRAWATEDLSRLADRGSWALTPSAPPRLGASMQEWLSLADSHGLRQHARAVSGPKHHPGWGGPRIAGEVGVSQGGDQGLPGGGGLGWGWQGEAWLGVLTSAPLHPSRSLSPTPGLSGSRHSPRQFQSSCRTWASSRAFLEARDQGEKATPRQGPRSRPPLVNQRDGNRLRCSP